MREGSICHLRPLDAVLSSGLCGKGGGLTSRDRPNSSENYMLLGFLLAIPSQQVLLLVRQSVTKDNCSISVSYPSSSKVKVWKNSVTLETEKPLFKKVELGQETVQRRNKVLPFFVNY